MHYTRIDYWKALVAACTDVYLVQLHRVQVLRALDWLRSDIDTRGAPHERLRLFTRPHGTRVFYRANIWTRISGRCQVTMVLKLWTVVTELYILHCIKLVYSFVIFSSTIISKILNLILNLLPHIVLITIRSFLGFLLNILLARSVSPWHLSIVPEGAQGTPPHDQVGRRQNLCWTLVSCQRWIIM